MGQPPKTKQPCPWLRSLTPGDQTAVVRCGDLEVEVGFGFGFEDDELRLRQAADGVSKESEAEWRRWVLKGRPTQLEISPALPDLPIVVVPEHPFHLVPDAKAQIYVRVPLWLEIRTPKSGGDPIAAFPTRTLSQTWFGDLDDGDLCYLVSSSARRQAPPSPFPVDSACAPVAIHNRADEVLEVERLCLRVAGLSIYRSGADLWTSETRVTFRGGDHRTDVRLVSGPPKDAAGAKKLRSGARDEDEPGFARTFRSLLDFARSGPLE